MYGQVKGMSQSAANDNGATHHGFSQKARGVLLQPEHPAIEKVVTNRRSPSPVAPHRGFNEKAREVLLNSKSEQEPSLPFRIKGGDKINQIA